MDLLGANLYRGVNFLKSDSSVIEVSSSIFLGFANECPKGTG